MRIPNLTCPRHDALAAWIGVFFALLLWVPSARADDLILLYDPAVEHTFGPGFYAGGIFYGIDVDPERRSLWSSRQTLIGVTSGRIETSDDFDTYIQTETALVYGDQYYLFSEHHSGLGVGYLLSVGVWEEVGQTTDYREEGDFNRAVFQLFLAIRPGPFLIEPSALGSVAV